MTPQEKAKNPYANLDGTPKDGELVAFCQWESDRWHEKIDKMTDVEREKYFDGLRGFFERMTGGNL